MSSQTPVALGTFVRYQWIVKYRHNANMANSQADQTGHGLIKISWRTYQQVAAVLGAIALAAMISSIVDVGWRSFLATLVGYWADYVRPATKWALDLVVVEPVYWAFGWHLDIPLRVRDYLAVGAVLGTSAIRATGWTPLFGEERRWSSSRGKIHQIGGTWDVVEFSGTTILFAFLGPLIFIVTWPLWGIYFAGRALTMLKYTPLRLAAARRDIDPILDLEPEHSKDFSWVYRDSAAGVMWHAKLRVADETYAAMFTGRQLAVEGLLAFSPVFYLGVLLFLNFFVLG